jgi:hypothetical protein
MPLHVERKGLPILLPGESFGLARREFSRVRDDAGD